ncbi:MAG: ParB/RepB/Spo0J family partition protein [Myxococcaceae bacterium]|nr:ParB/RepB/Spo0J family partition protein [Myxococcaceae bacterium]MCI0670568.1 ParB/RepB/Spo0J family partition protein [Myxococcaceae bacterium]
MSSARATKQEPKRALGRGLGALIPQAARPPAIEAAKGSVAKLPLDSIRQDKDQPRRHFDEQKLQELAGSIKAQGILQPLLVRKDGDGYKIIAGERRWRAAHLAGLTEVPAVVRDVTPSEAFQLALVENLQRSDLNPIEEAEGYRRLIEEFKLTQEQVSQQVGKDRSTVANALRLLALPPDVKQLLADGSLAMGHARALLGVPRLPELAELAKRVATEKLSVRETERLVQESKGKPQAGAKAAAPATKTSAAARNIIEDLQRRLGTKVRLQEKGGGRGTLEIDFFSYEDLERILAHVRKER